nr:hypothetical protein [Chloroflexota bacterium]
TQLTFSQSSDVGDPGYHFAFNIASRTMAEAKAWLASRVPLLDKAGEELFSFEHWTAESIYFRDPAGNIGELIARHTLADDSPAAFGPQHLRCVSEIGLPAPDVSEMVDGLVGSFDLERYGETSDSFSPVGDERGLFIVVREGRPWFPTDSAAEAHPISALIEGATEASLRLAGLPYEIRQGSAPVV